MIDIVFYVLSILFCCSASVTMEAGLQTPHGGNLVDLMVGDGAKAAVAASATKTIELSDRNACDVELLIVGYVIVCIMY